VLEPVAIDEAAPRTTDDTATKDVADLIANLALRVSTLEQQTATRLTKLEKRATQTETNIAFLDDGNEIASLQKQVDEIRDNLRTFAETAEGARVAADKAAWLSERNEKDIAQLDERTHAEEHGATFADFDALQTAVLRATDVPLGDRLALVKQREEQRRCAFDAAANPEDSGEGFEVNEYTIPVRNWKAPNDYETYEIGADE
jgi:TolA-binding protein